MGTFRKSFLAAAMVSFMGLTMAPSDASAWVIGGNTYCPDLGYDEFTNDSAPIRCPQPPENPSQYEYDLQGLLQNLETPYTGQGKPLDVDEATDD